MLKGINQWCFPANTPIEEVYQYSAEAGFETVELYVEEEGIGLDLKTSEKEALKYKQQAEELGLQLRSIASAYFWNNCLASPDANVRQKGIDFAKKMMELAKVMGADTILVVPGIVTQDMPYDEVYKRSQETLAQLIPFAKEYEIKIGIENVWNRFLLSPLEMARYIDELESQWIGCYFDVGNILQYGYPEQWIRILNDRIVKVHVKDYRIGVGTGHGFVPLLSGDVAWKRVMQALKLVGYNDTLIAEVPPYPLSTKASITDLSNQMQVLIDWYGDGGE